MYTSRLRLRLQGVRGYRCARARGRRSASSAVAARDRIPATIYHVGEMADPATPGGASGWVKNPASSSPVSSPMCAGLEVAQGGHGGAGECRAGQRAGLRVLCGEGREGPRCGPSASGCARDRGVEILSRHAARRHGVVEARNGWPTACPCRWRGRGRPAAPGRRGAERR